MWLDGVNRHGAHTQFEIVPAGVSILEQSACAHKTLEMGSPSVLSRSTRLALLIGRILGRQSQTIQLEVSVTGSAIVNDPADGKGLWRKMSRRQSARGTGSLSSQLRRIRFSERILTIIVFFQ